MAIKKGEGTHEVVFSRVTIPRFGENLEGWLTRPQERPAPALLVSPDAWGITGFTQSFQHRLGRQGYSCLAVEPYSRGGQPRRSDIHDQAEAAFAGLPTRRLAFDLRAGLDYLRKSGDADVGRMGILAFGDGARAALDLAADPDVGLRAAALLWPRLDEGAGAEGLACPVLALNGAQDGTAAAERTKAFAAVASGAGASVEMLSYPEAGRGFMDDERDSFEPASADDAWTRLLAFLDAHLRS